MRIILPERVSILSVAARGGSVVVDLLFEELAASDRPAPGGAAVVPIRPHHAAPERAAPRHKRWQIGVWAGAMLICFIAGAVAFHGGTSHPPVIRSFAPPPEELGMPDPHEEAPTPTHPAAPPSNNPWGLE